MKKKSFGDIITEVVCWIIAILFCVYVVLNY